MENSVIIEVKNLTKKFGTFVANKGISMAVKKNEVFAILGENGAGKTTLMNMLYGMFEPTEGETWVDGKQVRISSPSVAMHLGIGMVHQHFMLVENFTVAQNIILGKEIANNGILDLKKASQEIKELSKKYMLEIDPDALVEDISVGAQQKIEILKVLYRGANIIIFDEPTAVLTPQEVKEFIKIVKNLQSQGKTILIITHKLKEIRELASRCAIIRRGELIDILDVSVADDSTLAEAMVGKKVVFDQSFKKKPVENKKLTLQIKNLNVMGDKKALAISDFSLDIHSGEIMGIAGVEGNGQREFVEALIGLRKTKSGNILINGQDITNKSPKEIIESKISCIPEDRQKRGLVLDFTIYENMVLRDFYTEKYSSKNGLLNFPVIKEYTQKKIEEFDIRPPMIDRKAYMLSGGNQQKIILAREISRDPELIIAAQPTRGLDVGAIENIHDSIIKQRNAGKAVLLISFELEEIMSLADKIAVLYKGSIIDIVDIKDVNEEVLGIMMMGMKVEKKA